MEWQWILEHKLLFFILGLAVILLGILWSSESNARRTNKWRGKPLHDKLVSGEEYKQKDVEHK